MKNFRVDYSAASSWWMVRSDRLSHPAAFIYEEGRVIGFSTEPFFEQTEDGKRQSIRPDKGHFCHSVGTGTAF